MTLDAFSSESCTHVLSCSFTVDGEEVENIMKVVRLRFLVITMS